MIRILLSVVCLALICLAAPGVRAGEVTIPGSHDVVLPVEGDDPAVRLLVWVPEGDVPDGGYPVLYFFDGEQNFAALSSYAENMAGRARRAGKAPAMLVGITYPEGTYTLDQRIHDLTPYSASGYDMPERPNKAPWQALGGGDRYLDMITARVQPYIRANFPADPDRETLFGHSFGGMMVLHTLFARQQAFDAYFAASPSIWFNNRQVMREAEAMLVTASVAEPVPLYITVGEAEDAVSSWESEPSPQLEARKRWVAANRMVDNVTDLVALIAAQGEGIITIDRDIIAGADHGSVLPPSAYRAVMFAIDPVLPE